MNFMDVVISNITTDPVNYILGLLLADQINELGPDMFHLWV